MDCYGRVGITEKIMMEREKAEAAKTRELYDYIADLKMLNVRLNSIINWEDIERGYYQEKIKENEKLKADIEQKNNALTFILNECDREEPDERIFDACRRALKNEVR